MDLQKLTHDTEIVNMLESSGSEAILSGQANKLIDARDFVPLTCQDFTDMFSLLKAVVRGEYKKLPWLSLCICAGAISYVAWKKDLIDDSIPKVGRLDDTAVVMIAGAAIRSDIEEFIEWEHQNKKTSSLTSAMNNLARLGGEANES